MEPNLCRLRKAGLTPPSSDTGNRSRPRTTLGPNDHEGGVVAAISQPAGREVQSGCQTPFFTQIPTPRQIPIGEGFRLVEVPPLWLPGKPPRTPTDSRRKSSRPHRARPQQKGHNYPAVYTNPTTQFCSENPCLRIISEFMRRRKPGLPLPTVARERRDDTRRAQRWLPGGAGVAEKRHEAARRVRSVGQADSELVGTFPSRSPLINVVAPDWASQSSMQVVPGSIGIGHKGDESAVGCHGQGCGFPRRWPLAHTHWWRRGRSGPCEVKAESAGAPAAAEERRCRLRGEEHAVRSRHD